MDTERTTLPSPLPEDALAAARATDIPELQALLKEAERYLTPPEQELIARAFLLADQRHKTQFRASGEAYIYHPIAVTMILAGYRMDAPTLAAALLHDTVEDTGTKLTELTEIFGSEVSMLVGISLVRSST